MQNSKTFLQRKKNRNYFYSRKSSPQKALKLDLLGFQVTDVPIISHALLSTLMVNSINAVNS